MFCKPQLDGFEAYADIKLLPSLHSVLRRRNTPQMEGGKGNVVTRRRQHPLLRANEHTGGASNGVVVLHSHVPSGPIKITLHALHNIATF